MIVHDNWCSNESAQFNYRQQSLIDYDEPFDLGLRTQDIATSLLIRQDSPEFTVLAPIL